VLRDKRQKDRLSSETSTSRRRLLRSGVGALGATFLPTIAGASNIETKKKINTIDGKENNSEKADRIQAEAIAIRKSTGSQEAFKDHLRENSDYFTSRKNTFIPASSTNSGRSGLKSTHSWSSDAISTELSLVYHEDCDDDGDEPYAYFDFEITLQTKGGGHGEGGPDQMSIGWADDHYRLEEGYEYSEGGMDNLHLKKRAINGVDFEWEDGYSCYWDTGCEDEKRWSVGCKAQILKTNQERGVQASYWDMYNQATVESVSFSTSGDVSFTFSEEGKSDQQGFTIKEDSDASRRCQA